MRVLPKNKFVSKKRYLINYQISAQELRVIDNEGKNLGIISKEEALRKAQDLDLDLVLIVPLAKPPVAKIVDFKKFLYQENKKERKNKSGQKGGTKDINLGLFIAENDLQRLIKKGQDFIKEGFQLRLNLTLKGREITKKQRGFDIINRFIASLGQIKISKPPKLEGRVIRTVVVKSK